MRAAAILLGAALAATSAYAQGSRKDDVVLGPTGHPIAGATIRVCQNNVSDRPCAELATIYTDATLTVTSPNPFQADGMGNYHFYAPVGRYQVQISGPGIAGTLVYNDMILPPDNAGTGAPGGGDTQVQINKSGALGAATGFALDSSTSPTKLTVPFDLSVKGPQPRIDVTAYGAKGDGGTDDTAAIQAAINATCANSNTGSYGDVFFPPHPGGWYKVLQPQSPSTAPVFTIPLNCRELHFTGGDSEIGGQGLQFDMSPSVKIEVTDGASPNSAPVFLLQGGTSANGDIYGGQNSTFENLMIQGHNEAIELQDTSVIHLRNICLATDATTGQTDNTPLKVENTIWVWWQGGCAAADNVATPDDTQPVVIFDEANLTHNSPDAEIYLSDLILNGGGIQWISRVTLGQQSGTSGSVSFRNIVLENSKTDFLAISAAGGDTNAPMYNWVFDNIQIADSGTTTNCIVSSSDGGLLANGFSLTAVWNPLSSCVVKDSAASSGAGHFAHLTIHDSSGYSYTDGSGSNLSAMMDEGNQQETSVNLNTNDWMNNTLTDLPGAAGTGFRVFDSSNYAKAELGTSLLFGSGLEGTTSAPYGYSAALSASGSNPLQISFPKTLPALSVSATATTGGTLAAGTYYYWVQSCVDSACTQASAPSAYATVTISGANNAASLSWTAPSVAGTTSVGYYRVLRGVTAQFNTYSGGSLSSVIVTAPTTSITDTGSNFSCCMVTPGVNTMAVALGFGASSVTPAASGSYALGSSSLPFGVSYFTGIALAGSTAHTVAVNEGAGAAIAGAGPGTSGQILKSAGASADPLYIDFPDAKEVPAANCNNTTAGNGWSIGSGGTVSCRAGTNNKGGYISITDTSTTFATFQISLPEDWDTGANPYVRFKLASTDTTSGHTVIPSIQVACYKGDGSTTDDVAANAAHSLSTVTLNATANQFWSTANAQMNSTDVTGCVAGALMQITVGRAADTATNAEFYSATVTFPRLLKVQAN